MEMQAGELFANRYRLIKEVGRGSFGEVWQVRDEQLDLEVALKVYIALDERGLEEFKGEYKNTYALNHPNLLHATYFGVDEKRPYLVMPYCPASAVGLLGEVDEGTAWRFLRDVAGGLAYLHGQDILHRDIKPDNILRNEAGDFVITDFGISLRMRSTLRRNSTRQMQQGEMSGTIGYMGPELFGKKAEAVKATDIWALGASLYELLSGELPFMGQGGVMQLHGAEIPEIPERYGKELQEVLEACLSRECWDRPTAEQLRDYAEAKLQGRKPVKTWGEPSGSAKAKDGTTGKPEAGKVEPTIASKAEVEAETTQKGQRKIGGVPSIVLAISVVLFVVVAFYVVRENQKEREKAEWDREQISIAERARQDSIADAQAEMQRQAREAEERRQAEEARQKAEQERERQAAEAKAEQERLAQQERERQEEARKQREAEARRRATSNRTIRVGNVSFEMVYVQGGTFQMGATAEQGSDAYDGEKPVHSVTLSDFHIGKYEVTQGLWKEVMGENPSYNKAGDNYPVEMVSWEDCQRFIERLNSRTGLNFRLPTEAEWEYAARGGQKSRGYKYSGSTYDLGSVAWYEGNSGNRTHPVGQKQANELGLYDMSGNVYEWCYDWYGRYSSSSQRNPSGPASGARRVLRGGCYCNGARFCRVSIRVIGDPGYRSYFYGLRLVLAP